MDFSRVDLFAKDDRTPQNSIYVSPGLSYPDSDLAWSPSPSRRTTLPFALRPATAELLVQITSADAGSEQECLQIFNGSPTRPTITREPDYGVTGGVLASTPLSASAQCVLDIKVKSDSSSLPCENFLPSITDWEQMPFSTPGFCQRPSGSRISGISSRQEPLQETYSPHSPRSMLYDNVKTLLVRLELWDRMPLSDDNDDDSISTHRGVLGDRKRHAPEYNVTEVQVVHEAKVLTLRLINALHLPKTSSRVLWVSDQLWDVRDRYQDICLTYSILADVGLKHLRILERMQDVFGRRPWLLHDLWSCAADCLQHLSRRSTQACFAAKTASFAARGLSSIHPHYSRFFEAVSLHYESFLGDGGDCANDCFAMLTKSLELFVQEIVVSPSNECVREMLRAMASHCNTVPDIIPVAVAFSQISSFTRTMACDPSLATLYIQVADLLDNSWEGSDGSPRLYLVRKIHPAIVEAMDALQLFRDRRPFRFRLALAAGYHIFAKENFRSCSYPEAIEMLCQAIECFRTPVLKHERNILHYQARVFVSYVHMWLSIPRCWDLALQGFKLLVGMSRIAEPALDDTDVICACLKRFHNHCRNSWSLETVPLVRGLIDVFCRKSGPPFSPAVLRQLLKVLVAGVDKCRYFGSFKAASEASHCAISLASSIQEDLMADSDGRKIYMDVLICQTRCLHDEQNFGVATIYLRDAMKLWGHMDRWHPDASCKLFSQFGVLHTFYPAIGLDALLSQTIREASAEQQEVLSWFCINTGSSGTPCLEENFWCFFVRALVSIRSSRVNTLEFAQKALDLLSDGTMERLRPQPHMRASVLGHKYMLLVLLGKQEEGRLDWEESMKLYHITLESEPNLARLPLLLLTDVLTMLLYNTHTVPRIFREIRRMICGGSISSLDKFVTKLSDLPRLFVRPII